MKVLVDVNLTPAWVAFLRDGGVDAVHWAQVGDPKASDETIMAWARDRGHVVFTHDLDFGVLLAMTHASGPSVLQLRTQDTLPAAAGTRVLAVVREYATALLAGALVTIDIAAARVRILPIRH